MKLLELRAAPFQPNPMANVTVTWRSLTESLLSTAPKYLLRAMMTPKWLF
eukprot:COSAG04_NODE_170_length_21634_cov_12.250337_25_plen_50_part_00